MRKTDRQLLLTITVPVVFVIVKSICPAPSHRVIKYCQQNRVLRIIGDGSRSSDGDIQYVNMVKS